MVPTRIMTTRTTVASKALAIRGSSSDLGIRTGGEGIDLSLWSTARAQAPAHPTRENANIADQLRSLLAAQAGHHHEELLEKGRIDSATAVAIGVMVEEYFELADGEGITFEHMRTVTTLADRVAELSNPSA